MFCVAVFDDYYFGQDHLLQSAADGTPSDLNDGLVYLNSVKSENDSACHSEPSIELDVLEFLNLTNGTGIIKNSLTAPSTSIQPCVASNAFQPATIDGSVQSLLLNGAVSNSAVSNSPIGGSVTMPIAQQPLKQQQLLQQLLEMQSGISSAQLIARLLSQMHSEQQVQTQTRLTPQQVTLPVVPHQQVLQQVTQPKLTMTLELAVQFIQQAGLQQSTKHQVPLNVDLTSQVVQQQPHITPQQISFQQQPRLASTNVHTPAPIQLGLSRGTDLNSIIQPQSTQLQSVGAAQRLIIQQLQPQPQASPLPTTVALPQSVIFNTQPKQALSQMSQSQQPSQITLQQLQQVKYTLEHLDDSEKQARLEVSF